MDFETFKSKTQKIVEAWPCDIKLFHLHFTIDKELNEVQVGQFGHVGQVGSNIIKIHRIYLPPGIVQKQTVYKSQKIDDVYAVAKDLFDRRAEIGLIGAKLEILMTNCLSAWINFQHLTISSFIIR